MSKSHLFFRRLYYFLSGQLGFDLLRLYRTLIELPRFFGDLLKFAGSSSEPLVLNPCLQDRLQSGGSINSEYFWQDLFVAHKIFQCNPIRHLDVGSRVDGFVAHLASFRSLDVMDVRPIDVTIPHVSFFRGDLLEYTRAADEPSKSGSYDSVSCLHVLEHLGLGRYGDSVCFEGYKTGIKNLCDP